MDSISMDDLFCQDTSKQQKLRHVSTSRFEVLTMVLAVPSNATKPPKDHGKVTNSRTSAEERFGTWENPIFWVFVCEFFRGK